MRFINDTLKLQFMKRILLLLLLCSTTLLMAQQTDPIQEAMASYDYETALSRHSPIATERQSPA